MEAGLQTIVRPFHRAKAEVLTDLVLGKLPTPNVMILEPPRVGKTDLGVKAFESWALTYFPDSEFINGSCTTDRAIDTTKEVRSILTSDWYRSMVSSDFGARVALRGDQAAGKQEYFHTMEGGSVKAVGAGSAVIGFGAGKLRPEFGGAIMIDDPIKPQERNSATVRKSTIDWIVQGLEPRRNRKQDPMTPMVLIMQRLHPQDPAGYFLSTERRRWTVIELPALDAFGASIWPERISEKELEDLKERDPETYWSQYMQTPSDEAFMIFVPKWWKFWNNRAEVERRITLKIITADTAFKEEEANDYSVLQCWGFENTMGAYLLDQVRGKWIFPDLVSNARDFLKKHSDPKLNVTPATEAWVEDKASGTSLVQTLRREGLPFREWLPKHRDQKVIEKSQQLAGPDKVSRAKQCTMPLSAGRVFLPHPRMQGFRWVENYLAEHTSFSADFSHLFDDQVDTTTEALLIWQQRGGGVGPIPVWKELPVYP